MEKVKEVLLTFVGKIEGYKEGKYIFEGKPLVDNGRSYIFNLSQKLNISNVILFINNSLNYEDLTFLFEHLEIDIDEIYDLLSDRDLKETEEYINQNSDIKVKLTEINDKDLEKSFKIIKKTIEDLKKYTETININIDITHSYRHLPLFVLLSLDILNIEGELNLKNIFYAIERDNYYEILKLKNYITFMNFSKALRNFIIHGQIYDFAQELRNFSEKTEVKSYADLLEETDFYLNLNHLDKLRENFKRLNTRLYSVKTEFEKPPLSYVYEEFEKFIQSFQKTKISEFQFRLAKWHLEHRRYALGLIALREAFISKYIEEFVLDKNTKYDELKVKKRGIREKINNPLENTPYYEFWFILRNLRNISAHNLGKGENQDAVENYDKFGKVNKKFLQTLSPKYLRDYFPKSLEDIFNSIKGK